MANSYQFSQSFLSLVLQVQHQENLLTQGRQLGGHSNVHWNCLKVKGVSGKELSKEVSQPQVDQPTS